MRLVPRAASCFARLLVDDASVGRVDGERQRLVELNLPVDESQAPFRQLLHHTPRRLAGPDDQL